MGYKYDKNKTKKQCSRIRGAKWIPSKSKNGEIKRKSKCKIPTRSKSRRRRSHRRPRYPRRRRHYR